MNKPTLYWQKKDTPPDISSLLRTLAPDFPIREGKGNGIALSFVKAKIDGACEVERHDSTAMIRYSTPAQAGRAVGALLSGLVADGSTYRESTPFRMLGIMLDCSRNAVMTVEHIQLWMRRLSLLGYNMVMLYTEDTYELPGEPYFGFQRGAYTEAEIKAIDAYAAKLNIEVIPCIQTLGHLEKMLRHPYYTPVRDTWSVMMVEEPKTYQLIEKMIVQWKKTCRTDRIHIGMDETHDLGRGRYLDQKGYRNGFELFNNHLAKVVALCKKHGLKPMIWSDMYFRLGSKTMDYYDQKAITPRSVIKKIPKAAELVYWDYYHYDKAFYLDWIQRHRKMGKEPLMGSGIYTWSKYWYDHRVTEGTAGPCIEACREAKVKDLFFTQWGDNGAYCDHDSAFAGMVFCAEKAYSNTQPSQADLEKRFAAVCGGSYAAHILASDIQGCTENFSPDMWDDSFIETGFRTYAKDNPAIMSKVAKTYADLARKLASHTHDRATGDLKHAYHTAKAFADRYALAADLLAAYRRKDKKALGLIRKRIPGVSRSVQAMANSFRSMWLSHNKPLGLETIQGRFGMLNARYEEMSTRLAEYIKGDIKTIPELDCHCPPL